MAKTTSVKKSKKQEREHQVLLGLVELYLNTGKPIGSNTLKEAGFQNLSSATIRNYFTELEEQGYLHQPHTSGGRIPTDKSLRLYANENLCHPLLSKEMIEKIEAIKEEDSPKITTFLQKGAEILSTATKTAVFMLAPRFDQDFVLDIKLLMLDSERALVVIVTNFGVIKTEVLRSELKLNTFRVKRIESYFMWRLTGNDKPENLESGEEELAQAWYNEAIIRYIIGYTHFTDEEIFRTGLSQLLNYEEFENPAALSETLSLFENNHSMRLLLKESLAVDQMKFWIGDDLKTFTNGSPNCSVLVIPYYVNQKAIGAIGIMGPKTMSYRKHFGSLRCFSNVISETLTHNIYKYRITYREPTEIPLTLTQEQHLLIEQSRIELIEHKSHKEGVIPDERS